MQLTSQTLDITVQSKLVKFLTVTDNILKYSLSFFFRKTNA